MNFLKLYTTLFLLGFIFPALSFAQNANEHLLQQTEHLSPEAIKLLTNKDKQSTPEVRRDEDVLSTKKSNASVGNVRVNKVSTDKKFVDNVLIEKATKKCADDVRKIYESDIENRSTNDEYIKQLNLNKVIVRDY